MDFQQIVDALKTMGRREGEAGALQNRLSP